MTHNNKIRYKLKCNSEKIVIMFYSCNRRNEFYGRLIWIVIARSMVHLNSMRFNIIIQVFHALKQQSPTAWIEK